jgi:hypothetical protein
MSSLGILMACGKSKAREKHDKSTQQKGVWGRHDNHQGIPMMRSITLIMRCCLVLILRKGEWNELIGHPKDRGKNRPNSRTNSLQQGENDADCVAVSLFNFPFRIRIGVFPFPLGLYFLFLIRIRFFPFLLGIVFLFLLGFVFFFQLGLFSFPC